MLGTAQTSPAPMASPSSPFTPNSGPTSKGLGNHGTQVNLGPPGISPRP